MLCGGRISQHARDSDYFYQHTTRPHRRFTGLKSGFRVCSAGVQLISSIMAKPFSGLYCFRDATHKPKIVTSSTTDLGCPERSALLRDISLPSNCSSQQEVNHELPANALTPLKGGIVALGKFDALHIGHRELAIQASKVGAPFLLSFVGMAEVLGWEPRAPIVAKCDRKRVLSSWATCCGNVAPREFEVEFSSVRHLSPQQFVEKLANELGVSGVVTGENYRFGYKASGDASDLKRLCKEFGIGAYIISSVMDKNQSGNMGFTDAKERGQVSSTRVRHALARGDMLYVSKLLGRPHRLLVQDELRQIGTAQKMTFPKSHLLNLPPKEGFYGNCSIFIGDDISLPCNITIDPSHIDLEFQEVKSSNELIPHNVGFFGIEFDNL